MSELPKWPNLEDLRDGYMEIPDENIAEYERARADAAMARLRKLHKAATRYMASDLARKHADYGCVEAIAEALIDIGELPPE